CDSQCGAAAWEVWAGGPVIFQYAMGATPRLVARRQGPALAPAPPRQETAAEREAREQRDLEDRLSRNLRELQELRRESAALGHELAKTKREFDMADANREAHCGANNRIVCDEAVRYAQAHGCSFEEALKAVGGVDPRLTPTPRPAAPQEGRHL